jgi:hypothetical protein
MYERAELAIMEAFDIGGADAENLQLLIPAPLVPDRSERIRKLPATLSPPAYEAIPGPASAGEDADWFPEDATVTVWSGDDESRREMLTASLNENRIRCRWEKRANKFTLFVQPDDESRAREIIREVIEAAPPS